MLVYLIILESPYKNNLSKFTKLFKNIFLNFKLVNFLFFRLPSKRKKTTVLKSPHIFKKSMETFEEFKSKFGVIFYIKNNEDFKLKKIVSYFSWSFLGVSIKKVRYKKKNIYL